MSDNVSATRVTVRHKMVGMPVFDDEFTCNGDFELSGIAQWIIEKHGGTVSSGFRMWLHRVEPGFLVRNLKQTVYEAFLLEHKPLPSASPKDGGALGHHVTLYYDFDPPDMPCPLMRLQVEGCKPKDRKKDQST